MKIRLSFFAGAAAGYVLGTKAGRERYAQIQQYARRFSENPNVQQAADTAKEKATTLAATAKEKVPAKVSDKVPGFGSSDTAEPDARSAPKGVTQPAPKPAPAPPLASGPQGTDLR